MADSIARPWRPQPFKRKVTIRTTMSLSFTKTEIGDYIDVHSMFPPGFTVKGGVVTFTAVKTETDSDE